MTVPHELPRVLAAIDASGLRYAITGSLASTAWGRPRATYDVDILVALRAADAEKLAAALPAPDWYVDRQTILEAVASGGEFNAIHGGTGTKVDFWVSSNRPADAARLARRRRQTVMGVECWLLSPEDTILAKLEWTRAAPSDRQRGDVDGIIAIQGDKLDREYLREWADRLDVRASLEAALGSR